MFGRKMMALDLACAAMESRAAVHGDIRRQARSRYRRSISASRRQQPRLWKHRLSDVSEVP